MPMYITERDAVLRERKAAHWGRDDAYLADRFKFEDVVKRKYPLPLVTRPRVVKDIGRDPDYEWRYVEKRFEGRPILSAWGDREWSPRVVMLTPGRMSIAHELWDNPTEEVEE